MGLGKFLCALTLSLLLSGAAFADDKDNGFVPAASPAEKALDNILQRSDEDYHMSDYVLDTPTNDPDKDASFAGLFTLPFLHRMAATERAMVQQQCGGTYSKTIVCGFDYNPITCSQDSLPDFFYHTEWADDRTTLILFSYATDKDPYAAYTMRRIGNAWMLDNVQCLAPKAEIEAQTPE